MVGQVAQQLGALAGEGYDEPTLETALAIMLDRRLHPSTLPTLLIEAQAGPARRRSREHSTDRHFRQAYGIGADELNERRASHEPRVGLPDGEEERA